MRSRCRHDESRMKNNMEFPTEELATFYQQSFQSNSLMMLWVNQQTYQIIDANEKAQAFYQYPLKQLQSMQFDELCINDIDDNKELSQGLNGQLEHFTVTQRTANGELKYIEVHVTPTHLDNKQQLYMILIDVTQHQQTAQELKQGKEWLGLITGSSDMAMWEWDIQKDIVEYDAHWAELLGYTNEEIQPTRKIWERLVHPQDKPKSIEQMNRILNNTDKSFEIEQRLQSKSGEWRWFMSRGTVVEYTKDNKPLHFIGIDIDITNRKTNEIVAFQYELERQRMLVLSAFIESAKHEFKTPLSRINTKLYLIRHTQSEEKRNQITNAIEAQVEEIDHLVDSMMLMARLDTINKITNMPVYLRDILNTLVIDVANRVKENQQTLISEIPTKVPTIRGDTDDLYEAFHRIFDNAIRYTPPNGHINVSLKIAQSNILIEIRDTGAGISEEALPHIFERFFREDQAHTTSGIGLGLPIAKSIIEQCKGDIRISSTPNVGTIVQVRLPLRR